MTVIINIDYYVSNDRFGFIYKSLIHAVYRKLTLLLDVICFLKLLTFVIT